MKGTKYGAEAYMRSFLLVHLVQIGRKHFSIQICGVKLQFAVYHLKKLAVFEIILL